jgi:hypothetical protein
MNLHIKEIIRKEKTITIMNTHKKNRCITVVAIMGLSNNHKIMDLPQISKKRDRNLDRIITIESKRKD